MRSLSSVLFFLLLGALLARLATSVGARHDTLPEAVESQEAIAHRTLGPWSNHAQDGMANWRNRVMVPYTMEALERLLPIRPGQAYLLVRWLTASLMLAGFAAILQDAFALPKIAAVAGAGLHALAFLPTFFHIYDIPSDFLDSYFFGWLTVAALQKRRARFGLLLLVALTNRESAVFATFVWWALHAFESRRAFRVESLWCLGWGLGCAFVVRELRHWNAASLAAAPASLWQNFRELPGAVNADEIQRFLGRPGFAHPFFYLAGYLVLSAVVAVQCQASLRSRDWRLLAAAGAIFLVSMPTNHISELRMYVPSVVLVDLVLIAAWFRPLVAGRDGPALAHSESVA